MFFIENGIHGIVAYSGGGINKAESLIPPALPPGILDEKGFTNRVIAHQRHPMVDILVISCEDPIRIELQVGGRNRDCDGTELQLTDQLLAVTIPN